MSKTAELNIPRTAAERIEAKCAKAGVSPQWLDGLCAHVDEDGLIGEAAAKALLKDVLSLRALLQELDDHFGDEVDINDNGGPNDAMRWQQRIREVLGTSKF